MTPGESYMRLRTHLGASYRLSPLKFWLAAACGVLMLALSYWLIPH